MELISFPEILFNNLILFYDKKEFKTTTYWEFTVCKALY